MARGINKVILVGNCCQDPETRHSAGGAAITNISIATSESWKDKQSGQTQERAEFHRIVFFNRLGEIAGQYLKKGSKVYIEGRLQTRKWQDQQGQDRYTTEIVASEMQMLDSRNDNTGAQALVGGQPRSQQAPQQHPAQLNSATQQQVGYQQQPPMQQAPQKMQQQAPQHQTNAPAVPDMDSFDDDIPF